MWPRTPRPVFITASNGRRSTASSSATNPIFWSRAATGRIAGILPLSLVASPWFGRILCSMPYVNYGGPCADDAETEDALTRRAVELTDEIGAKHLEMRTRRPSGVELPVSLRKVSLTLTLNPDPEVLCKGFTSKHRTNIRRAEKNGLTVRAGGLELLDTFYAVMERSWQHLGTPLYRKQYFTADSRDVSGRHPHLPLRERHGADRRGVQRLRQRRGRRHVGRRRAARPRAVG